MMFKILTPVVGFVAVSGTTLGYYFQQLKSNNSTAQCKPHQQSDNLDSYKSWFDNWDYRHPTSIEGSDIPADAKEKRKAPTATRHVILVRHGHYEHSKEGKVLTELGREQARLTGERLKALGIEFDNLVISSKVRALQTGTIIADILPNVPQEISSLLEEGLPCPPNPSRSDLETYEWKLRGFADEPRIEGAFRKYMCRADPDQEKDSYDLLVCHGNVIRYFVCRALQFPPEGWLRMNIANCGITWISIRPSGRVTLRGVGDVGHLPSNLITGRQLPAGL